MSIEENLEKAKKQVEQQIKMEMLKKNMSQAQLAKMLKESRAVVNLAIKGNTSPKSIKIRKKIYQLLEIK